MTAKDSKPIYIIRELLLIIQTMCRLHYSNSTSDKWETRMIVVTVVSVNYLDITAGQRFSVARGKSAPQDFPLDKSPFRNGVLSYLIS